MALSIAEAELVSARMVVTTGLSVRAAIKPRPAKSQIPGGFVLSNGRIMLADAGSKSHPNVSLMRWTVGASLVDGWPRQRWE